MQLTETKNEGLSRAYQVVVTADALASRADKRLQDLRGRVKLDGFRHGKVPVEHLRRLYGRSVMAEVLNDTVGEATRKLAGEHELKLAGDPQVDFPKEADAIEQIIAGKSDLAFTLNVEVLPKIEIGDFSALQLKRDVTAVTDEDMTKALTRLAEQNRSYDARAAGAVAQKDDRLKIDYRGTLDGTPFDGGTAEGAHLVLGSKQFIPGFEDQLVGVKAGETRVLNVTFPEGYNAAHLAGKAAAFEVTVHEIAAPRTPALDDAFAKTLGLDTLEALKDALRKNIANEDAAAARYKLKRRLLDALDGHYTFPIPPLLARQEFDHVWRNMEEQARREGKTLAKDFADSGKTEDQARAEFQRIAERRVRLGLLLAAVGERQKIDITQDEVNQALSMQLRQFPGREREILDYYRNNQAALAQLRAPIFEEKVVDYILELAKITDASVSREELYKDDEEA